MATKQITQQEYEARNLSGFEGDTFLKTKIEWIIERYKIKNIIETGTYIGGTTKQFCSMVENVFTCEINKQYYDRAKDFLKDETNVLCYNNSSLVALPQMLKQCKNNTIIFIDSHWQQLPLLEELKIIARSNIKPVIIIHDFYNPNHSEFGCDTYNNQRLDWNYIHTAVKEIYAGTVFKPHGDFKYEYNTEATGAMRGVIFIYPKQ